MVRESDGRVVARTLELELSNRLTDAIRAQVSETRAAARSALSAAALARNLLATDAHGTIRTVNGMTALPVTSPTGI